MELPTLFLAEPPAAYLTRPPLVVMDRSVLCALLFSKPMRDEALRQLAGHTLHAPCWTMKLPMSPWKKRGSTGLRNPSPWP